MTNIHVVETGIIVLRFSKMDNDSNTYMIQRKMRYKDCYEQYVYSVGTVLPI